MLKELLNKKEGLINSSLKVLFTRVLGIVIFFGLSLFLTNNFSPESVGRYDFARSILLVVGGICLLGTNQSIIYYSGYFKANNSIASLRGVYIKMVTIIIIVASFFLMLKTLIKDDFFNTFFDKTDASEIIFKVIVTLFIYSWAMLNVDMIRAMGKTLLSEFYRNILRYLPFFIVVLILASKDMKGLLIEAYLISFSVLWLVTLLYIIINIPKSKTNHGETPTTFKSILFKSYPMAISAISFFMLQSIDIILLGRFEVYDKVAYYSVAVKLATITTLSLISVNIVIAPKIAELHTVKDLNNLQLTLTKSSRIIFGLNLLSVVILILLSNFILTLFGDEYVEAKNALIILLIAQLISSLCGSVGVYMNMTGKQLILQRFLLVALFLNIVLNWLLIPKYSLVGAAYATSISIMFWNVAGAFYLYRKDSVKTFLN